LWTGALAIAWRRPARAELLHIDLLAPRPAAWRRQLPDCRLQTLEQGLPAAADGRHPGQRIPAAYAGCPHRFRAGDGRDLYHNAVDLVTLFTSRSVWPADQGTSAAYAAQSGRRLGLEIAEKTGHFFGIRKNPAFLHSYLSSLPPST